MKRQYIYKNIVFNIANYQPRENAFEKGLKYQLFVSDIPTNHKFSTIKDCKQWINNNYFIFI